jgi:uncharacterized protein (DUF305 family)
MTSASKPRVPAVLITVLVATVALGAGWFFGVSSVTPPLEGSPEVVFARDMRFHHEQAVDMSLRILGRTTDREMRLFVTDILLTQQNQVGQMTAWLALWGRPQAGAEPPMAGMGVGMGLATQAQLEEISTLSVKPAEILFLQLMHRHHQGGIMMAQDVLNKNPKPEVARLAAGIVSGQRVELKVIESLLRRFGGEIPQTLPPMKTSR